MILASYFYCSALLAVQIVCFRVAFASSRVRRSVIYQLSAPFFVTHFSVVLSRVPVMS